MVFTKTKLNYKKSSIALGKINFTRGIYKENVTVEATNFPELLAKAYGNTKLENAKDTAWNLNVLRTNNVNQGNTIASWKEDIFLTTQKGFFGNAGGGDAEMLSAAAAR